MKQLKELDIHTHLLIHRAVFWLGIVLCVIGCQFSEQGSLHLVAWLGIAAVLLSNLWRILFIKCPHCGSGMYNTNSFPTHCPDCGKKLPQKQFRKT